MAEWDSQGRLSSDDLGQLTGQVAGLVQSGLPLPSGLRALAEELPRPRLRRSLNQIAEAIESGMPIEDAMAEQGNRLPAHVRGLLLAASRTGKFGEVLGRYAGYTNVGTDLKRSLWLKLIYPAFAIMFAAAIFIFVCVMVANGFEKIFKDFGMAIPAFSRLLFAVARIVNWAWQPLAEVGLVLGGLGTVVNILARTRLGPWLAAFIPLLAPVWRLTALAEFSHLLALLVESEVPLVEALPMAAAAVRHGEIESASRAATRDIAQGRSLADALATRRLFPRGLSRILAWAEAHCGLPEALHLAGELFEARARSQASFVSTVCSVLAVLSILGGIVMTILAVMVPLITLISRLSG